MARYSKASRLHSSEPSQIVPEGVLLICFASLSTLARTSDLQSNETMLLFSYCECSRALDQVAPWPSPMQLRQILSLPPNVGVISDMHPLPRFLLPVLHPLLVAFYHNTQVGPGYFGFWSFLLLAFLFPSSSSFRKPVGRWLEMAQYHHHLSINPCPIILLS